MTHILQILAALLAVLAAIVGLAYVLRYYKNRFPQKSWWKNEHLKVLETVGVDSRNRLVLVECGSQRHLLLVGATSNLLIQQNVILEESAS